MKYEYEIVLHRSDEGYSASVPVLPGCWSEGDTVEEALANIRDAIREYVGAIEEQRFSRLPDDSNTVSSNQGTRTVPILSPDRLVAFARDLFQAGGVAAEEAAVVAQPRRWQSRRPRLARRHPHSAISQGAQGRPSQNRRAADNPPSDAGCAVLRW